MVAILVVLLFIAFITVEIVMNRNGSAEDVRLSIPPDRFPVPAEGVFVTGNHLTAVLAQNGRLIIQPDTFLTEAAGPGAGFLPAASDTTVREGDRLYELAAGQHRLEIAAPFDGRIVSSAESVVIFEPARLREAISSMKIGDAVTSWWHEERRRLARFLAQTPEMAGCMADGAELAPGFLTQLAPTDARRFGRIFLERDSE